MLTEGFGNIYVPKEQYKMVAFMVLCQFVPKSAYAMVHSNHALLLSRCIRNDPYRISN